MPVLQEAATRGTKGSSRGLGSQYEIKTTVYVRNGILLTISPSNLPRKTASDFIKEFENRFTTNGLQDSYKHVVSAAAKTKVSKLAFRDLRVISWPTKTALVVDYPLLTSEDGLFEMRGCFGLCKGKGSSKVWTRINPLPVTSKYPIRSLSQVGDLCKQFRCIANRANSWTISNVFDTLPTNFQIVDQWGVQVTILGIENSYLQEHFEKLNEDEITARDILADNGLDSFLTKCSKHIADFDLPLSEYAIAGGGPTEHTWFKMKFLVILPSGQTAQRPVLFFLRDLPQFTEIVGFAYDDSASRNLAIRAGAEMSNMIGPWI